MEPIAWYLTSQDLQNVLQGPNRPHENRVAGVHRIPILLHSLECEHQVIEIFKVGGFEIGDEVEVVEASRVIQLPLDCQ